MAEVGGDEVGQGEAPSEYPLSGDHHATEHRTRPNIYQTMLFHLQFVAKYTYRYCTRKCTVPVLYA